MSWKTILVHLDDGARCAERVALAARLAAQHGSHLVGLSPTGLPDVALPVTTAVPDPVDVVRMTSGELREKAHARAAAFEQAARTAGVESFEALAVVGEALETTTAFGRSADLVVVGQTDRSADLPGIPWDLPQQVALHTGGPILIVPFAGHFASIGGTVLAAWKDTREAARALHDALPLLREARRTVLLELAEPHRDFADESDERLRATQAWLARHGVTAEARRETVDSPVGEALLSRAYDLGAEAIVMGAYGHARLREWALGGTTRDLLDHTTVPTLMSH